MHRFLFWQKALHDFCTFRHLWRPLAKIGGISPSRAMLSLDRWLDANASGCARELLAHRDRTVSELDVSFVKDGIRTLYQRWDEIEPYFEAWFREAILTAVPSDTIDLLDEVFRFDRATMPIYDAPLVATDLEIVKLPDTQFYLRRDVPFAYDVPSLMPLLAEDRADHITRTPIVRSFIFPSGFANALENGYGAALGGAYIGTSLQEDEIVRSAA